MLSIKHFYSPTPCQRRSLSVIHKSQENRSTRRGWGGIAAFRDHQRCEPVTLTHLERLGPFSPETGKSVRSVLNLATFEDEADGRGEKKKTSQFVKINVSHSLLPSSDVLPPCCSSNLRYGAIFDGPALPNIWKRCPVTSFMSQYTSLTLKRVNSIRNTIKKKDKHKDNKRLQCLRY